MSRLRREDGFALPMVMVLAIALAVFSVVLIDAVTAETQRSATASVRSTAYAAAEAGLNDYLTKLLADRAYYSHEVHPGEAARQQWTGGSTWTYASGRDAWRAVGNGYEYDLQITPPSAASPRIRVVAAGRPVGDANVGDWRVIERRSSGRRP